MHSLPGRAIFDALPSAAILDADGVILDTNSAWYAFGEANGLKQAGCIGCNYLDLCATAVDEHADTLIVADGIRAIISGQLPEFSHVYSCHSLDQQRWFSIRVSRLERQVPVQVLVVHTNITDQIVTKMALQKTHNGLEQRVDDPTPQLALINADLKAEIAKRIEAQAALQQSQEDLENRVIERTLELNQAIQMLKLEATEHLYSEWVLRRTSETLNTIIQASPLAIVSLNLADQITSWNPAAERIFGWTAREVLDKPNPMVCTNQAEEVALLRQRLLDGEVVIGEETQRKIKSGSLIDVSLSGAVLRDSESQIIGFMTIIEDITERKRAQEEVRRQARLLASVRDAIFAYDLATQITYWNKAAQQLYGFSEAEALGKNPRVLLRSEISETQLQTARESIKKNPEWHNEAVHYTKSGKRLVVESTISRSYDRDGNEIGHIVVIREISERKQAEEALRQSEERFRIVTELVSDFAYAFDLNLEGQLFFKWMTEAFTRITGFTVEEIEATGGLHTQIHPDDLSSFVRHFEHIFAGEADVSEFRIVTKSGQIRWLRNHIELIWDETKQYFAYGYGAAEDITERKEAEAALNQHERQFRALIENSTDGILLIDVDSKIIYVSPSTFRILGYTEGEAIGLNCLVPVHPEDQDYVRNMLEELQQQPERVRTIQYRVQHRAGNWVWVETIFNNLLAEPGIRAVVANYRDITERKQLQNAERLAAVGRLAASIAHEINNPLQAVHGALALVQEDFENLEQIKTYIEIAQEEIVRAIRVIAHLREVYRPSREEKTLIDLNEELNTLLPLIQKRLKELNVELVMTLAADLPLCWGAADKIRQVFLNITLNALDAMQGGGLLTFSTEYQENTRLILVKIADSGSGISDEHLVHVFDPFFSTKVNGSGLGLSISRSIIFEHHGQLDLLGKAGEGTTCTITLPAHEKKGNL